MDLSPSTTVTTPVREKAWLGSKHGTESTFTVTLDIAGGSFDALIEDGGYVAPNGDKVVPSGTPVIKGTGDLYVLATGAGVVAEGHLFEDVIVRSGTTAAGGAVQWHGVVIAAKVPGTFVAGNHAPHILYR